MGKCRNRLSAKVSKEERLKRTGFLAISSLFWIGAWSVWMSGFSWSGVVGALVLPLPFVVLFLAHRSGRIDWFDAPRGGDSVEPFLGAVVPAWKDAVESARGETEQAVQELIHHFRRINSVLENEDVRIRSRCESEIAAILVAMQFQDRVRQILTHVALDMDAMSRDRRCPADTDAWREHFRSRLASGGGAAAREEDAAHRGADEVTFF